MLRLAIDICCLWPSAFVIPSDIWGYWYSLIKESFTSRVSYKRPVELIATKRGTLEAVTLIATLHCASCGAVGKLTPSAMGLLPDT